MYEGGLEPAELVRETARLNRVWDTITVKEAIVAEDRDVYGEKITETTINPSELIDCDVLEMDCEGAELPILENLEIEPRVIIVESHPTFGAPPETIREILVERGYKIIDRYELDGENVTFTGVKSDSDS